ncbi:hypothetical protein Pelo_1446 [Pelomyxa schiedti]|nr:hypothetical protein Pelo_1446 [Pelomyxa schiedti]
MKRSPHSFDPFPSPFMDFIRMDEGTGKLQPMFQPVTTDLYSWSQLNQSQFCVFEVKKDAYEVWDVNETNNPVRTNKCPTGCTTQLDFVEGGLLFQLSESHKEIHVTEESSGAHVITFQALRPITAYVHLEHYSFPSKSPSDT